MSSTPSLLETKRPRSPRGRFQIWHLSLLVAFVAVAIANLQDQRTTEPVLIAIAIAGFVAYAGLAILGWKLARRSAPRLGSLLALLVYLFTMTALFIVASGIYVTIDYQYKIHHR